MKLRSASTDDVPFVMRTERLPGYETTVGRWEMDQHAREMEKPDSHYLIAEECGVPVAFAILQGLLDEGGNIYLKRIAVTRQGDGIGKQSLRLLQDWVFAQPNAHRFFLHYSERNERGRRLYAACGFQHEGVEREVYLMKDGTRANSIRVSILRHEWEGAR